ncbi:FecR family protein [Sphingobacterium faecale]|uniref:FecR family protein n=1 Tax=Sphingobacterium faecale TaxID=2803775 RepID=A0ABS1QY48_9SPHI|nr:FecR family protein [Sphingobacterium faecale]MBL1407360.1 FecR family protein [Sphingobacterium faecale]
MIDRIFKLSKLVAKKLLHQLDDKEMDELKNISKEAGITESSLSKSFDQNFYKDKQKENSQIDSELAFEIFRRRTQRAKTKLTFFKAAAATAALFLFFSALLWYKTPSPTLAVKEQFPEETSPGYKQAVLTLSNGQKVVLDEILNDKEALKLASMGIEQDTNGLVYRDQQYQTNAINTLQVPLKGEYQITLADGTRVWLNSSSTLKYPNGFAAQNREVYLDGEAYFEVAHNPNKPFVVHVDQMKVKVLGTKFNINSYNKKAIKTSLVSGKVSVRIEEKERILYPENQAQVDILTGRISIMPTNTEKITGWTKGKFIFDDEPLSNIMSTLSRWYGIKVHFGSEEAQKTTFTGTFYKKDNLEKIMQLLTHTQEIKYRKEGQEIYITK